jgi:hypothetical protein
MLSRVLGRLFADPLESALALQARREPRLIAYDGTTAATGSESAAAADTAAQASTPAVEDSRPDLRNVSPRRFAELTHEMYLDGTLNWDEFKMVGFPSELDPRYDETIGALTGEKANPDQPRDMLGQWEDRVSFETRLGDAPQAAAARTILDKLTAFSDPPLNLIA